MDTRAEHLQMPLTATKETEEPPDPNVTHSATSSLPHPTSNPKSSPEAGSGTTEPLVWVPVPYVPIQVSTQRRAPSIERYLGNSYEYLGPVPDSTISNASSSQGPETKTGLLSATKSTLTSVSRSITEKLLVAVKFIRVWSLIIFNTLPFPVDALARLLPNIAGAIPSAEDTTAAAPPDVIMAVPLPLFPIRVFYGKPPPFSHEVQKCKMRWRYRWRFGLAPEIIQEPNIQQIQETVQQYIDFIAPETEQISVRLLAQGAFNQAYNIAAENKATGFRKEYVFRVALPIYPHYKIESDVATTEFVRHTTTVPVPIIYAFDSCPNNKLGFEWMLMEKVKGVSLYDTWDTMEYSTKQELTKTVANWVDQLSRINSNKIGSLYCRQRAGQMEFYMGPLLHSRLYEGDRLLNDVFRGPFESLQALYDAVLDSTERHINDPRHSARHKLEASMLDEESSLSDEESSDGSQQDVQKTGEEILAQADEKDRRNERQYGVTEMDLEWLPDELRNYRDLLPKLCPQPPTSEPMITMLTHPDLSAPNIFVNESGAPVALIDWERARFEPIALLNTVPHFLIDDSSSDPDYFYVPPGSNIRTGRKENKIILYGDEDLALIRGRNEKTYTEVMSLIQETHLRALYRQELRRLQSPICKAFERDVESLDQQLISRVFWPERAPPNSAIDWAAEYLDELTLAGSDAENDIEDREELEGGRTIHETDNIVDTATAN